MTAEEIALQAATTLMLCLLVGVLSVVISDLVGRFLPVPAVVLEILGGILLGPAVLGFAHDDVVVSAFSELGLALLMFLAGYEIQLPRVAGPPLRSALWGWAGSLLVGLGAGIVIVKTFRPEDDLTAGLLVGLLFTTTALGTILPILRDTGDADTPFGSFILSAGAIGEFGPIVAIALLLSGDSVWHTVVVLIAFLVVAAIVFGLAQHRHPDRLTHLLRRTLSSSGQLGVRTAMLLVLFMVWVAAELGLDVLLGAFTAGLVARYFLSGTDDETHEATVARIEGVGFGLLIPIFFVVSGIRFDLDALLSDAGAMLLVPLALVLFLLIRGGPTHLSLRGSLFGRDRVGAAVYASTALPLIVVITGLGVDDGTLHPATAAALVGAGMLSVLIFPLAATRIRGGRVDAGGFPDESDAL
ncbi:cation:proton antiporter [Nocardioides panacihumi]|uniref:Cation:proton antiporter n=1 Tax=Nocardioides panacihumi TaxID=400774 RepID=A0ABN2QYH7_9ACTN